MDWRVVEYRLLIDGVDLRLSVKVKPEANRETLVCLHAPVDAQDPRGSAVPGIVGRVGVLEYWWCPEQGVRVLRNSCSVPSVIR
jgi:hypothetical protein